MAKYDPYTDTWSELGSLNPHSFIATAYPVIMALCTDKKHNIYASGIFTDDDNHCYVAEYGISNLRVTAITTSDFTVYPNPIENEINIKTSKVESYEYTLFDGMGRLYKTGILSQETNKETTIDISSAAAGMYILRLNTNTPIYFKLFKN